MAVEVRGAEEWRRLVADQRPLVRLGRYPEHDDVEVPIAGLRVGGVGSGIAKEHERLVTYLVDGILTGSVFDRDMRHAKSKIVHVVETCPPAPV